MKQRLLGAVVLIALAIIFVPMLFSGSGPKRESATVDMEIPPLPDREFETRVMPVDATSQDPGKQAAPVVVTPEPVATVDTKVAPRVDALPETIKPPVAAEAAPPASSEVPKEAPRPATPEQLDAGKAAKGSFLVHLGVYAESKNADELVATLKRSGFPAFAETAEFKGKSAQRVRVGPFADRAEAEAARIRIKQIRSDVPGSVIGLAEDAKADVPASPVPATRVGGWAVQLGAFTTAEDANKLRARLQTGGFAGFVDKFSAENQTLWRVRVGPEVDRGNAEKLRDRIKEKMKLDGLVVSQP
ncbi:SPOR domain-containing protein [Dokdonella sp.]|uniref:SPOR domain-containing protein n=1 Tax=Dokdonella sp. TaxID=2291710 RepID=UPI002BDE3096|nr:SPOR domain-containing protein [Dokdonella sp.]HOX70413.1 SPOR domain-containing protein [Dokdonella sp.]HPN78471.1 SPOR domain-containing protein [Dokdonella sp.]